MEKILVTGCAGFIGSHLTERLLNTGCEIIGIDNFHPYYSREIKEENIKQALNDGKFYFYEADILDVKKLSEILIRHKPDTVVHFAALPGVRNSFEHPEEYFKINTEGTKTVFDTALAYGVRHFVFASSSSVYGEMVSEKAVEDSTPLNPISPYAQSKVNAENIIGDLFKEHSFTVNILRFFTVYGIRQRPDMAFQKFRRKIKAGEPVELYGENMSRDFTPIDRIITGVLAAIRFKNGLEVFNLGSGERVPVRKMIEQIGEELNIKPKIKVVPRQKGDPSYTLADISKARKLLGY